MIKNKYIKRILLVVIVILLFAFILLISNNNVTQWISQRIEEIRKATTTETIVEYEVVSDEDDSLQLFVTVENSKGIDKIIIIGQDITLECNGKTKVAIDRVLEGYEVLQLRVKLIDEETTELFTLVKATDFELLDEDETTTTLEIQYAVNEKLINYYSLDDGETWEVYTEPLNIPTINDYVILTKTETTEGKVIQITESSYPLLVSDSILNATKNALTYSGYFRIAVKDEDYNVHAYVVDENLTIFEDTAYGDENDIATESEYAKHMVILKVNGNLTIDQGATLTAYNSEYGGPKGMLLYVTDTITNNGTISMTARGAKAEGKNVYLFKNEDKSYEYVPAIGAEGGNPISIGHSGITNGNVGYNGTNRQTGGGGTGAGRSYREGIYISAGGTGTSYSGGSGSGAANSDGAGGWYVASGAGSSVGGAGGLGVVGSWNKNTYGQMSLGGTGNPTGGYQSYRVSPVDYVKREGTGGLLNIYSSTFDNNGSITANGVACSTSGRSQGNSRVDTGGASGGGSINIFYSSILNKGEITADGGESLAGEGGNAGGAGGNGTVSIGNISSGTYVEYVEP